MPPIYCSPGLPSPSEGCPLIATEIIRPFDRAEATTTHRRSVDMHTVRNHRRFDESKRLYIFVVFTFLDRFTECSVFCRVIRTVYRIPASVHTTSSTVGLGTTCIAESVVKVRSPFCGYTGVELNGEDLSCCSNRIEPVCLRKRPYDHRQSVFERYHSDKHFSEFLPTTWRQKSTGIDMERNYVTVAL